MNQNVSLGAHKAIPGLFYHLSELSRWKNGEVIVPLYVEISPTSRCNQRCPFCYVDHLTQSNFEIPSERLVRIFKELGESGVKACEVQGTGEPFMNKALPEAILAGKKSGMDICIVTNGTLLNEKILDKIIPCTSFFRVSSLEANGMLYQQTHGCSEDHYELVLRTLRQTVNLKHTLNLSVVIVCTFTAFSYNLPYIFETAKLLKDIGIDIFTIKPAFNLRENHAWEQNLHEKYREEFSRTTTLQDDSFKVNIRDDFFDFYGNQNMAIKDYSTCYGCDFEVMIDADCKIYPCFMHWRNPEHCLGDISNHSFKDVWFSQERKDSMAHFFNTVDARKCNAKCKQDSINGYLSFLKNPPLHVNVI